MNYGKFFSLITEELLAVFDDIDRDKSVELSVLLMLCLLK